MPFEQGHSPFKRQSRDWSMEHSAILQSCLQEEVKREDVEAHAFFKFSWDEEAKVEKISLTDIEKYYSLLVRLLSQLPGPSPKKSVLIDVWKIVGSALVPKKLVQWFVAEEAEKLFLLWNFTWRHCSTETLRSKPSRSVKLSRLRMAVAEKLDKSVDVASSSANCAAIDTSSSANCAAIEVPSSASSSSSYYSSSSAKSVCEISSSASSIHVGSESEKGEMPDHPDSESCDVAEYPIEPEEVQMLVVGALPRLAEHRVVLKKTCKTYCKLAENRAA